MRLTVLTIIALAAPAAAENWPDWRGPSYTLSAAGDYPAALETDKNLLWEVALPGDGTSTPAVWGDTVYVTCPVRGNDAILAFGLDGKEKWRTAFGPEVAGRHRNASGCNPSPVTDGESVFACFKSGTLAAVKADGTAAWKVDIRKKYGPIRMFWDFGTSPVLTKDDVVMAVLHAGKSYVVAFNKLTGEVHWKVDRNYRVPKENDQVYATPVVIEKGGKQIILVWGAEHVTAHDAADGSLIWDCGGFNPGREKLWPVCASMAVAGDTAIVPYGRGERLTGVRVGGSGDVTKTNRAWVRTGNGCFVPTPAVADGKVYILRDKGEVVCLDPKTGKTLWENKFPRGRGKYYSSPLVAGGKLYAARNDGTVMVADVSNGWKFLSENDLGERVIATPVPVGGKVLVRGDKHLWCFD